MVRVAKIDLLIADKACVVAWLEHSSTVAEPRPRFSVARERISGRRRVVFRCCPLAPLPSGVAIDATSEGTRPCWESGSKVVGSWSRTVIAARTLFGLLVAAALT